MEETLTALYHLLKLVLVAVFHVVVQLTSTFFRCLPNDVLATELHPSTAIPAATLEPYALQNLHNTNDLS